MSGRNRRGKRPIARGLKSLPGGHLARLTPGVFVSDEVSLEVSFPAARARLADLTCGGLLGSASQQAYSDGITGLARVGPLGSVPGLSRLVQVHSRDLKAGDDSAWLPLRWEVAGPGGGLFPVLDADITLIPAGTHSATLTLTGAYRPPPGAVGAGLDRVIVHRIATATVRAFLHRVARAITHPARAARSGAQAADLDPARLPPEPDTP